MPSIELPGFLAQVGPALYAEEVRGGPEPGAGLKVSVVIPTWNRCEMLEAAVGAVFRQDLPPSELELLVVDDGSSDGTAAAARRWAQASPCPFRYVRLKGQRGPGVARNVGVTLARGEAIAFTDSDCLPTTGWLRALLEALAQGADLVQGPTGPPPGARTPLFSHFMHVARPDGFFAACNIAYRRQALLEAEGFDPALRRCEDADLGWRVRRLGGKAAFAPAALVYHRVMPLSPWGWMALPRQYFSYWPALAARHPEFRRHLFLGLWVDWFHALFDLFVIGLLLSPWRRRFLLLGLPYLVAFPRRHGLRGRWPPLKAAAHLVWDAASFVSLVLASIRFRSPVL